MSLYLIGDLQGCATPLTRLLETIDFSPSKDTLYFLGDLINRGPDSLAVLRRLSALGDSAQCLLGNHDLHALGIWQGVRRASRGDTLDELWAAPDADDLMHWLRHRPLAMAAYGWLLVHAGVLPQWTCEQTLALASELEQQLRCPDVREPAFKYFLTHLFGNQPLEWDDSLKGVERWRVIVNALTRLRFCTPTGEMEFSVKGGQADAPPGYVRWFEVPDRATLHQPIAFGHWSTLNAGGILHMNTLALDTGCVWGGCLTAARLHKAVGEFELIQLKCEQSQKPG